MRELDERMKSARGARPALERNIRNAKQLTSYYRVRLQAVFVRSSGRSEQIRPEFEHDSYEIYFVFLTELGASLLQLITQRGV